MSIPRHFNIKLTYSHKENERAGRKVINVDLHSPTKGKRRIR